MNRPPGRPAMPRMSDDSRYRLLVESIRDHAIFMLDELGFVVTWNVGAERLFGYLAQDVVGAPFSFFFSPDDIAADIPAGILRVALRENQYQEDVIELQKGDGSIVVSMGTSAIFSAVGTLTGYAVVVNDLSTLRIELEDLRHSCRKLEALVLERSALLANEVHQKKVLEAELMLEKVRVHALREGHGTAMAPRAE